MTEAQRRALETARKRRSGDDRIEEQDPTMSPREQRSSGEVYCQTKGGVKLTILPNGLVVPR